ncbi:hypothetical protein QNZ79_004600 [Vibrio parahaemolyticus]|uniref:hypothetical protein n=1 Tax=Vibrio parahaemolyticus TaxID=670 RepID=UPI0009D12CF5|nr:hypothetical protein [Vibrio parahaemolyticus]ELB2259679.1 hypothetical protein [Vibrio parahaemolyticus]OQK29660.1 hypothetical protein XE88_c11756 [Vibrio parahaemolyticus]
MNINYDYLDKFKESIKPTLEAEPIMVVLRTHLFIESMLEEIISNKIKKSEKLLGTSSFTFHHKLLLVEGFDILPDNIVSSISQLNKLRNQCAHNLNVDITFDQIVKLGSPLGKRFTDVRKEHGDHVLVCLFTITTYLTGYLAGHCEVLKDA